MSSAVYDPKDNHKKTRGFLKRDSDAAISKTKAQDRDLFGMANASDEIHQETFANQEEEEDDNEAQDQKQLDVFASSRNSSVPDELEPVDSETTIPKGWCVASMPIYVYSGNLGACMTTFKFHNKNGKCTKYIVESLNVMGDKNKTPKKHIVLNKKKNVLLPPVMITSVKQAPPPLLTAQQPNTEKKDQAQEAIKSQSLATRKLLIEAHTRHSRKSYRAASTTTTTGNLLAPQIEKNKPSKQATIPVYGDKLSPLELYNHIFSQLPDHRAQNFCYEINSKASAYGPRRLVYKKLLKPKSFDPCEWIPNNQQSITIYKDGSIEFDDKLDEIYESLKTQGIQRTLSKYKDHCLLKRIPIQGEHAFFYDLGETQVMHMGITAIKIAHLVQGKTMKEMTLQSRAPSTSDKESDSGCILDCEEIEMMICAGASRSLDSAIVTVTSNKGKSYEKKWVDLKKKAKTNAHARQAIQLFIKQFPEHVSEYTSI
jgi:hypothetical protein